MTPSPCSLAGALGTFLSAHANLNVQTHLAEDVGDAPPAGDRRILQVPAHGTSTGVRRVL